MSNPQQPEQRRSDRGGSTPEDSAAMKARQSRHGPGGRAHGTDKGRKGGGRGGATPPEQRPDHPWPEASRRRR
ncbi:hypothetical protein [Streptomyces sp. S584]|uniref:hypothetical protein n=1 Tax=Streptomyces sp. S584 TaxID=3096010 RepID=UPI002B002CB5|nr:hypothetical protein [Streptomyces sp. S584]